MSVQLEGPAEASQTIENTGQQKICQHLRRLIQDHSLDLANGGHHSRATLDEALRNVWLLEEAAKQS